jgi:uncharacterized membrane protein
MPPVHPAFVHFPIALVIFAFAADLIAHLRNSRSWQTIGLAALWGAVIGVWDRLSSVFKTRIYPCSVAANLLPRREL